MFKKVSKMIIFTLFNLFLLTNVEAQEYGSGDKCFSFDMHPNSFPYTSVTINGYNCTKR